MTRFLAIALGLLLATAATAQQGDVTYKSDRGTQDPLIQQIYAELEAEERG